MKKDRKYLNRALVMSVVLIVAASSTLFLDAEAESQDWDVNNDGYCNLLDVNQVAYYVGSNNPDYDVNNDGIVNQYDIQLVESHCDWQSGSPSGSGTFADDTLVYVTPAYTAVAAGKSFSVDIYCEPGEPIRGFQFDLNFDETKLQVYSVTNVGDIWSGYTVYSNIGTIDNANGKITYVYATIQGNVETNVQGIFATITFTASTTSIGSSYLNLGNVKVTNLTDYVTTDITDGTAEVFKNVQNTDTPEWFLTIQAAIDDPQTLDTHTIEVYDGTYNENVVVNKQLTIQAGSTPIIDGGIGGSGMGNLGDGDDNCITITVDGVTIDGFIVEHGEHGIVGTNRANCVVKNCEVRENYGDGSTSWGGIGMMFNGECDSNTFYNNEIHDNDRQGLYLGAPDSFGTTADNNLIDENIVYDNGLTHDVYGIQLHNAPDNTVTNNKVYNHYSGGNGWFEAGIYLLTSDGNTVEYNDVYDNGMGICLWSCTSSNDVNYNNIYGNNPGSSSYGMYNADPSVLVDAECNWWGHCSGPTHSTNPLGCGDVVSDYVDYLPWLDGSYPGGSCIGGLCADLVYVNDDYTSSTSGWNIDHFASIQTAIDRACDGGTVNVHPGTYVEDIMINVEDMTLTSTGATEDTKINGAPGGTSDVVTISAGNVTIDGFYITACISGASDGIDVRSDYNTISNNIVSGNAQGIYLNTSSDHNTVSNNTVLDNSGGIWLRGSSYNIISNNNASSNMNGIYGDQSSGNNTISNNKVDSNNMFGIYLVNCNYNLISNNTATNNNFGICTMASSHNEISNCTASNNIYDGIRLWSSSCYNTIIYCDIKNNGQIGICLDSGTSSNEAHYNNIVGNVDYGVDNAGTNQFNATCNWWGNAYGPLATDNVDYVPPTGKIGDSVSNYVDYTGWLDNHDVCTGVPEYDINMDGIINIVDINAVAAIFGSTYSPNGGIREDVSDDGIIDILDLQMVAYYFGDGGWE